MSTEKESRLNIRIEPALKRAIEAQAKIENRTVANFVKTVLINHTHFNADQTMNEYATKLTPPELPSKPPSNYSSS